MTVFVEFHLDTRTENQVIEVRSPFSDKGKAADKMSKLITDTANSSSAMMQVRDANTGDYIAVNTMKLGHYRVYEKDE